MRKIEKFILITVLGISLFGCGAYGVSYPKPEYNYVAQSNDPEFFFESQFSTNTQFKAKLNAIPERDNCLETMRVAYLQKMDSYFRHPDTPGPWKIAAPAGQPILIAGQWMRYGTTNSIVVGSIKTTQIFPGSSCPWVAKTMTPIAGAKYLVRLSGVGPTCELPISSMDGASVETKNAPNCARSR